MRKTLGFGILQVYIYSVAATSSVYVCNKTRKLMRSEAFVDLWVNLR